MKGLLNRHIIYELHFQNLRRHSCSLKHISCCSSIFCRRLYDALLWRAIHAAALLSSRLHLSTRQRIIQNTSPSYYQYPTSNYTYNYNYNNLAVSCCYPSPTSVSVGQSTYWTATVSGGNGSYSYSWTGTDGLTGLQFFVRRRFLLNSRHEIRFNYSNIRRTKHDSKTADQLRSTITITIIIPIRITTILPATSIRQRTSIQISSRTIILATPRRPRITTLRPPRTLRSLLLVPPIRHSLRRARR